MSTIMKQAACLLMGVWIGLLAGCAGQKGLAMRRVTFMTLDPGHFHASLVHKTMYDEVSPIVYIYAPDGPDVRAHMARIEAYNARQEDPTSWRMEVYLGDDYLERMLRERPGQVVVISGNNRLKARYIRACAEAGLNVLADKPMCIDWLGLDDLRSAFRAAERNGTLIYDIMTERSEITTILQRNLINNSAVFGVLASGTLEDPAIVKESVHHFYKTVSGAPLRRPWWFFDTSQQGEGIVDVTTHLIDLVMWTCYPERAFDYDRDIRLVRASRWPTILTPEQFDRATGVGGFPDELTDQLDEDGNLPCFANGEMAYTIRGACARVTVQWEFQAPEGGGDTHYSVVKGSNASIVVRQGREQGYRPELYVVPAPDADRQQVFDALIAELASWQGNYPGVAFAPSGEGWRIVIPDKFRIGHEAHFQQVTERFLSYLRDSAMPGWEVPNMLTKYRITTEALRMAQ